MPSLLEIMTKEDQATVKRWAEERKHPKYKQDIPIPLFICAQLGYYYGWAAVMDYRRGYSIGYEPELDDNNLPTGHLKKVRLAFELEDAVGLIKAAEKLHYRLKLDEGRISAASIVSSQDRNYAKNNAAYVNQLSNRAYE